MEPLFFLAAFFAEVIGTIAGFGSSTIFLPLSLLFFDFRTSLVLVALFHTFGNMGRITFFKHGLEKRILLRFGIASVLFTIIGALMVSHIQQDRLKAYLGLFLALYAVIALWKENLQFKPTLTNNLIGGSLSGFLAGLIGTGGVLRGAFLSGFNLAKEKYIATAAAIALAVDITRIPIYFAQGFLENRYYFYIPILLVVALLGSLTGKQIVSRIPQKQFRKIVLMAILIIGLKFIFDFTR